MKKKEDGREGEPGKRKGILSKVRLVRKTFKINIDWDEIECLKTKIVAAN